MSPKRAAAGPALDVSPTPEHGRFIAGTVASGGHRTAGEAVRAAPRLLRRFEPGGAWTAGSRARGAEPDAAPAHDVPDGRPDGWHGGRGPGHG